MTSNILEIDAGRVIDEICETIRSQVRSTLRKRGAVVAVSGGIDSSVCAALSARAFGPDHVFALLLPERDSSPESIRLGTMAVKSLGVPFASIDITQILESMGCYQHQLDAIREVVPAYATGWKHKITLPSLLDSDRLNLSRLTVETPAGESLTYRMTASAYTKLIAATNFKQRVRKTLEYFHADRLSYAVCGTPNRLEFDQGFFVKLGDGSADFKPIAHLYKSQVYMLAGELAIPQEIRERPPTTDTFGLSQTQEEFYFALPYQQMDLCLFALNHSMPAKEAAPLVGLTEAQVQRVFNDIEAKRRATQSLHVPPLLAREVPEIEQRLKALFDSHEGGKS